MSRFKLRESIAVEAARLIVRNRESDYGAARKRAARWLSRRRLDPDDLPTNAEIQSQVYALAGLFSEENQAAALRELREAAATVMEWLEPFGPRAAGCVVDGPVMIGSEITLVLERGGRAEISARLEAEGVRLRAGALEDVESDAEPATLRFSYRYPCEVRLPAPDAFGAGLSVDPEEPALLDLPQLRDLIRAGHDAAAIGPPQDETEPTDEHEYHPDAFAVLRMLLQRLESVRLDRERHPEGDALYHSLQVYELGLEQRPYDEEFLLACLLHDAGLALDRREPVRAALEALDGVVSERTCFLIEQRPAAAEYLRSGRIAPSLRRSEHFDDLVLLAQCDRAGRVAGARVSSLDEALEYIAGLGTAWDDA